MTPGQLALEVFKASVEFYIAPWRFLESEWQAAWELAAAAVIADSRVRLPQNLFHARAWQSEKAALVAENDRLRAALQDLEGK